MVAALSIIPVHRDEKKNPHIIRPLNGDSSLVRTLDYARSAAQLPAISSARLCVATTDNLVKDMIAGFSDVYLPERKEANLQPALQEALIKSERHYGMTFDLVYVFEPLHPFRPASLLSAATEMLLNNPHMDSVVSAWRLRGHLWLQDDTVQSLLDYSLHLDSCTPFIESLGLLCASRRAVILSGRRVGDTVGLAVLDELWRLPEIYDERSFQIAATLEPIIRH